MVQEQDIRRYEQLSPKILAELEDLDLTEQAVVAQMIRRAKYHGDERVAISDLSIVSQFLQIDPEELTGFEQQAPATLKAPLIKKYAHCEQIALPTNYLPMEFSIDQVMPRRVSRRDYAAKGCLRLVELSTLLYYSYGVREWVKGVYEMKNFPYRFAPSAGGLQSVEIYLVINAAESLEKGLYHYNAQNNSLEVLERGNFRRKVVQFCADQEWVGAASVVLFLTCDMNKVYWKYGKRAYRFVHIDAGVVSQNLHLVATALGLSSCMIAGYFDDDIHYLLQIDGRSEFIALLMTIGRKPEHIPEHIVDMVES